MHLYYCVRTQIWFSTRNISLGTNFLYCRHGILISTFYSACIKLQKERYSLWIRITVKHSIPHSYFPFPLLRCVEHLQLLVWHWLCQKASATKSVKTFTDSMFLIVCFECITDTRYQLRCWKWLGIKGRVKRPTLRILREREASQRENNVGNIRELNVKCSAKKKWFNYEYGGLRPQVTAYHLYIFMCIVVHLVRNDANKKNRGKNIWKWAYLLEAPFLSLW